MKKLKPYQKINSQEELDNLINSNNGEPLECFIMLSFGFRSSKDISFDENGDYYVFNEIDGSEEIIKYDNLNSTILGEALSKGCLYKY